MKKQAVRCLRRGNDDRASWYNLRTWESHIMRRFYDKQIDRASEVLRGLRGKWGTLHSSDYTMFYSADRYISCGKSAFATEPNGSPPLCAVPLIPCSLCLEIDFRACKHRRLLPLFRKSSSGTIFPDLEDADHWVFEAETSKKAGFVFTCIPCKGLRNWWSIWRCSFVWTLKIVVNTKAFERATRSEADNLVCAADFLQRRRSATQTSVFWY